MKHKRYFKPSLEVGHRLSIDYPKIELEDIKLDIEDMVIEIEDIDTELEDVGNIELIDMDPVEIEDIEEQLELTKLSENRLLGETYFIE